ncbi:MAG TPA: NUDIX domain-containing protein [Anaerolineales bacterium]|nr:NUDIX domain-containing protein [Anaerolineales bacterium]
MTSATPTLEKVTALITRKTDSGYELLLFEHPTSGIQIPAGTVEPGEKAEHAVLREAAEETGLGDLIILADLGSQDEPPPAGHLMVLIPTPVYARPDPNSFDWARFRSGTTVRFIRREGKFCQVTYEETDRWPDPQYTTYQITGWVPTKVLTPQCMRHFFHITHAGETRERWTVKADNHIFKFFWAPLANLPAIVSPQDTWPEWLKKANLEQAHR